MSSNRSVKDEDFLAGFAALHEAMATGFDGLHAENVRNDVSRLEQRMLRRFDDVDERRDTHETRITAREART